MDYWLKYSERYSATYNFFIRVTFAKHDEIILDYNLKFEQISIYET